MSIVAPPTPPFDPMEQDGPDSYELFMGSMQVPSSLPPRWDCKGKFSNLFKWDRLPDSIISQGELERLLGGESPVPQLNCQSGIELFGIKTGMVDSDLQQVVTGMLQYLGIMEKIGCGSSGQNAFPGVDIDIEEMEVKVAKCLAYLKELSYERVLDNQDNSSLLDVVHMILLSQERLCDLPANISSQPVASRYFHTWLEVRWALISVCYLLSGESATRGSLLHCAVPCYSWLEQIVTATVMDLLGVASKRFSSLNIDFKNITNVSIFGCPCIEEIWYCLFKICQKKDINFWTIVSTCCMEDSQSKDNDLELDLTTLYYAPEKQDDALYPMFLTSFLRLLHASGHVFDKPCKDMIFKSLKSTLKTFLSSIMEAKQDEAKLRTILTVVNSVFSNIGPSLDILDELWKFVSQNTQVNSSCRLKVISLESSTYPIPISSAAWLSQAQSISSIQDPTSFIMFIQIIVLSLESWKNNAEAGKIPKEPKLLISRISLKLNAKKLNLLNEYGVYHLGSLMLVLTFTLPDNQTPVTTLLQVLQSTQQSSNHSSQLTSLKCCLAFCLFAVEEGQSLNTLEVGTAISKQVGDVVTKFVTNQSDVISKRFAQDNIKIFIEALEEITDQSCALSCDEHTLIQNWISVYLSICSIHEISTICTALNNLLTRARIVLNTSPGELLETADQAEAKAMVVKLLSKLWQVVYPTIKSLSTNLTAPSHVANLAADFVIQSAENTSRGGLKLNKESVVEMIKYFGLNKLVTSSTSAIFLERVVHNSAVLDQVKVETGSHNLLLEVLAISSVHTGPGCDQYSHLTNTWSFLAPRLGLQNNSQTSEDLVRVLMEQLMNSQYTEILKCMARECSETTKWKGEQIVRMYQVGGWLVKHCIHILYSPGAADPTFTNLLSNLLTPSVSFGSSWILSGFTRSGLEQSLPDFLLGLCGIVGNDKFIIRKLTEIVRIYLPRFEISNHPLLPLLSQPSLPVGEESRVFIHKLTLNVVLKLIQENKNRNSQVATLSLKFLMSTLRKPVGDSFSLISLEIFPTLLELVTLTDALKNPALEILQIVVTKLGDRSDLQEKLNSFLKDNLAFNSERVFLTIRVLSVVNKSLVRSIFPNLERLVLNIEIKRGKGKDPKLQKLMDSLRTSVEL